MLKSFEAKEPETASSASAEQSDRGAITRGHGVAAADQIGARTLPGLSVNPAMRHIASTLHLPSFPQGDTVIQGQGLRDAFKSGDKLYGLETQEGRIGHRDALEKAGKAGPHPTIDSVNNAMKLLGGSKGLNEMSAKDKGGSAAEQEVIDYAKFLGATRDDLTAGSNFDDMFMNVRKSCKAALVYYSDKAAIHFELAGIEPDRIVKDFEKDKEDQGITAIELRALMRQKMRDDDFISERVQEKQKRGRINLENVHFYLNGKPCPAPWDGDADKSWAKAWIDYKARKNVEKSSGAATKKPEEKKAEAKSPDEK